jgi:hypothetical protein
MTSRLLCWNRVAASCGVATALISLGILGCSSDGPRLVPVSGTATLGNQPLAGATVSFIPEQGNAAATSSAVVTEANGSFRAMYGDRYGLSPGTYKVLVLKLEASEKAQQLPERIRNDPFQLEKIGGMTRNALPKAYSDPSKTSFQVTIPEAGKTDIVLDLDEKADEKFKAAANNKRAR